MTRFAIIATEQDLASKNIGNRIIELGNFKPDQDKPYKTFKKGNDILVWHDKELVFATDLSEHYDPECFVCVFRHKSENPKPLLSVHATGNLKQPMREGNPYELGICHPGYMLSVLRNLQKYVPEGYQVTYEATHHSPTNLKKPVMFVEIGSSEQEWQDSRAVDAVAKSVLGLLETQVTDYKACVGFGGGHYSDRFTRRSLEENLAFGHIIPSFKFDELNPDVIQQIIDKTIGCKTAVLDQRSQGKQEERAPILQVLEQNKIELVKLK
jgi:D-aminoacyl-tRNA deacylase